MIRKLPEGWKRGHLWEDGTWDEQGGHWIMFREEDLRRLTFKKRMTKPAKPRRGRGK